MNNKANSHMVVMKFGGTSVGSPERIKSVARLLLQEKAPKIVVLSAMSGVTNTLVDISRLYATKNTQGALDKIDDLEQKYLDTIQELYHEERYREETREFVLSKMRFLREFRQELFTDFEEKQVLAQGETISVRMMMKHLQEEGHKVGYLPALDFMVVDIHHEPDLDKISTQLHKILEQRASEQYEIYLTEGYICRNAYAEIDNLKRGGSDYTASLIGAAIDAREIQIWTDIDGLHNNDPRVVEQTKPVSRLHYNEASELAYFGAKILHPACIHPAKMANVPVRLLNSQDPSAQGTLISNRMTEGAMKAIAAKDGLTAIRILSTRMLLSYSFFSKVFEVFEEYKTPIDLVTTSEVAVSVVIDNTSRLEEILSELRKIGDVAQDNEMTIICVAGDLNWRNMNFESAILTALDEIPVRMISYGGSNYNVSVVVRTEDKADALKRLNQHLFE
ncbi:MAG: aspartate kinase [Porphyromonas sp.]|nr:aspartate kinase [Porphyromonas sp.]